MILKLQTIKRALILGVAAVQMDAIKVLNEMGIETYAVAMEKDGPGADVAKHFEKINILNIDLIIQYVKKQSIDAIYSTGSDLAMPIANLISENLGLPHFISSETAFTCNNKDLMRKALGVNFNGNVYHQVVSNISDIKEDLSYPLIMKPTDSQGQRGIFLVENFEQVKENYYISKQFSRSGKVILEQYIEGQEYSVNGYVVNGRLVFSIASERVTWDNYIGLIHKHVVNSKQLSEKVQESLQVMMQSACNKLGIINGPVYAQIKICNDIPYIIEITPRIDGCHMWVLLEQYFGINLLKLTFNHLLFNDISELKKIGVRNDSIYTLEFLCQEPGKPANYKDFLKQDEQVIHFFKYYNDHELVRPVNGKYDKIAYKIYKEL